MLKLNLKRPLAFFDLETTGVNVASDRIVEISIIKSNVDGSQDNYTVRVNPEIPIPKDASEIHGIYDKDVANCKTFKELSTEINSFLAGCDLAGYNSNKFDVPLLVEEFMRAEVDFDLSERKLVDVQRIFHMMEPRTLSAALEYYCRENLENAHSAEADTLATYKVLNAQLEKYNLGNDVEALHKMSSNGRNVDLIGRIVLDDKGIETVNFGKHKGKHVVDVFAKEPSYYHWIMNGDFPLYTKKVFERLWKKFKSELE